MPQYAYSIVVLSVLLSGCGGGGGAALNSVSTTAIVPPTVTADNRVKFDTITKTETLASGETTVTTRVGDYKSSDAFPKTDKYKIADYGFLEVSVKGTQPGDNRNSNEPLAAGPWKPHSEIIEADINGDGKNDFFVVENFLGSNADRPTARLLSFINDGNGHFKLSPESFSSKSLPCIKSGDFDNPSDVNSPCGFYSSQMRHPLAVDFNGDGKTDFYGNGILYLSDANGLTDRSRSNLPAFFYNNTNIGSLFTHDQYAGDADGDKDLDIFIPFNDTTKPTFNFDGSFKCATCNADIPWTMLINDGKGNFIANHNFPTMPWDFKTGQHLWATTAAIGDFDKDGFGDVAVGWFNPKDTAHFNMGNNSAGAVFFNNGSNDWRVRAPSFLPANWYKENGNANDIEVIDFDGDGKLDIILASTRHDPYYAGRMIQFFRNVDGINFVDVTTTVNPNTKYETGSGNAYWNGEGRLRVVDFDRDGDLDIVDSNYQTYVLLNEGGKFKLYENFPVVGGGSNNAAHGALYPVEIDGKYQYDFIGYSVSTTADTGTATYYQVLDPPSLLDTLASEFTAKPLAYTNMASLSSKAYNDLFYYGRSNTSQSRGFTTYNGNITQYGFVFQPSSFGFGVMRNTSHALADNYNISANSTSAVLIGGNSHTRVQLGYSHSSLNSLVSSEYFGIAKGNGSANTVGAEISYGNSIGALTYRIGGRYSKTWVDGFTEDADVPLIVDKQVFDVGTFIVTVDYTKYFQRKNDLFYIGADVEYLNNFYNPDQHVSFSTGSTYLTSTAASSLFSSQATVSVNAGAVLKRKTNIGLSISNLTKDPSYTLSLGMKF